MRSRTILVFLIAVVARLAFLAIAFDGPDSLRQPDSPAFELPAVGLLEHGVISLPPQAGAEPIPFTERVPGYIVFLAALRWLFGSSPLPVVLVQGLIDAVTCVVIARLAERIRPGLFLPAGLIAALAPNLIVHANLVLSDSLCLLPYSLFLLASVRLLQEPTLRRAALAGLWLGIATLVRPLTWYFIAATPLLFAALIPGRRRLLCAAAVPLCALAVVLPWLARNAAVAGHWALADQTGVHALYWVVPLAREYGAGIPADRSRAEMRERLQARLQAQGLEALPADPFAASAIMAATASDALKEMGVVGLARAWAVGSIINLAAPALIASAPVQRMERPSFYDSPGTNILDKMANYVGHAPVNFLSVILAAVTFTGLARLMQLFALFRSRLPTRETIFLAAVAAYVLLATGPITGVKYRLPIEPIFVVLLASGLVQCLPTARRRCGPQ